MASEHGGFSCKMENKEERVLQHMLYIVQRTVLVEYAAVPESENCGVS